MPAAATPAAARPAGETIRGADLFASGVYRGKPYSVADLDRIAANFRRLKDQLDPPAVLGHEEEQDFLEAVLGERDAGDDDDERTDQPAAGWVDRVWVHKYPDPATGRTEAILKGDIVGVPAAIADMIRKKRYRKISAEVYDDYTDDFGRSHGKALRRVAFLGAEVPQVKRLGDIPAPTAFAERAHPRPTARPTRLRPTGGRATAHGSYLCFAELTPMDRQAIIQQILAAMPGLQPATLDAMSDDQLADMAKNLPQPGGGGGVQTMADPAPMSRDQLIAAIKAAGEDEEGLAELSDDELKELAAELGAGGGGTQDMADPAAMTREELIAELVGLGQDPTALEGMDEEALRQMLAQAGAGGGGGAGGGTATPMSESAGRQVRQALSRLLRHEAKAKRERIDRHCEQLVKDGKVLPALVPVVKFALQKADDTKPVRKFSENGVAKTGTRMDELMAYTAGLPRMALFAEKLPGGAGDGTRPNARREERAVQKFAEANAAALRSAGVTPAEYVRRFTEARAKKPELTAADFGVPTEFYA